LPFSESLEAKSLSGEKSDRIYATKAYGLSMVIIDQGSFCRVGRGIESGEAVLGKLLLMLVPCWCCVGAEVELSKSGSQLETFYSSMDNRFNNLVNDANYGASFLQATIEEELDAEQDAIEAEDELLRATSLSSESHSTRIDHLMENLAAASKEVVVPKTLRAYEV